MPSRCPTFPHPWSPSRRPASVCSSAPARTARPTCSPAAELHQWGQRTPVIQSGARAIAQEADGHGDSEAVQALARLRAQAGDWADAEALLRQAADQGETLALTHLAQLRVQIGDLEGAEALYREAVNQGETSALTDLAQLRGQLGDSVAAEHIQRFGLSDDRAPGSGVELAVDELVRRYKTPSASTADLMPSGGRCDE
jgi:tetratricopeptide (TPR) repeat protein